MLPQRRYTTVAPASSCSLPTSEENEVKVLLAESKQACATVSSSSGGGKLYYVVSCTMYL